MSFIKNLTDQELTNAYKEASEDIEQTTDDRIKEIFRDYKRRIRREMEFRDAENAKADLSV